LFDEKNTILIKLKKNIIKISKKTPQAVIKVREITYLIAPRFLNTIQVEKKERKKSPRKTISQTTSK